MQLMLVIEKKYDIVQVTLNRRINDILSWFQVRESIQGQIVQAGFSSGSGRQPRSSVQFAQGQFSAFRRPSVPADDLERYRSGLDSDTSIQLNFNNNPTLSA